MSCTEDHIRAIRRPVAEAGASLDLRLAEGLAHLWPLQPGDDDRSGGVVRGRRRGAFLLVREAHSESMLSHTYFELMLTQEKN